MSVRVGRVRYAFSQPQCERCWVDEAGLGPGDYTADGPETERASIPQWCAWCGRQTWSPTYRNVDPRNVQFPMPVELDWDDDPENELADERLRRRLGIRL